MHCSSLCIITIYERGEKNLESEFTSLDTKGKGGLLWDMYSFVLDVLVDGIKWKLGIDFSVPSQTPFWTIHQNWDERVLFD